MTKTISLIGVGRLGICTGLVFEQGRYSVLGVDVKPSYLEELNNRTFVSNEPGVTDLLKQSKNFRVTSSIEEAVAYSDLLFVCVDTPSTGDENYYNTTNLDQVLSSINALKPSNKHIMVMCTVLPGYNLQVGRGLLKDCTNCTLNYNPEFIAQGAILQGFLNPDVVLIGEETSEAGKQIELVYRDCVKNEPHYAHMSPASAEVMKISLNCFVTTKIAFANMIGDIAERTPGADGKRILEAIGYDSRVGEKYLSPGWSFGGPCFPRDNRALAGYGRKIRYDAKISVATDAANEQHIEFQAQKLLAKKKDIYVFQHVAYKHPCAVAITEESAKIKVGVILVKAGKKVILRDKPHILEDAKRMFGGLADFIYEDISIPREESTIDG